MAHTRTLSRPSALNRRQFVAGMGAAALTATAGPLAASTRGAAVLVDEAARTLRFTRPTEKREVARALRRHAVPHRWVAPASLELHGWTIATPQQAVGFGWSSLDDNGEITEAWAELVVADVVDRPREFEIMIGDDLQETHGGRLVARVDGYPPICLRDLAGRLRPRDHVNLLAMQGPVARPHRLVAVA